MIHWAWLLVPTVLAILALAVLGWAVRTSYYTGAATAWLAILDQEKERVEGRGSDKEGIDRIDSLPRVDDQK